MLKSETPNENFVQAILHAYGQCCAANQEPAPANLWNHIVAALIRGQFGGFEECFAWRKSKARSRNAIGDIMDAIGRGHVPGLCLGKDGKGCPVAESTGLPPVRTMAQEYVSDVAAAITANPGARLFYFPPDKAQRREQNLRLAREVGFGLRDCPGSDGVLGSLYSTLVVRFSLDRTGVCVNAREFIDEVQRIMSEEPR
jgi:hypothetical protein